MSALMYDLNIERAVLSAALFDRDSAEALVAKLTVSDFYLPFHRALFVAISDLLREEQPVDEEFARRRLVNAKSWDEVAMLDVMSATPVSDITAYANALTEMRQGRDLIAAATQIKAELLEESVSPQEALASAQDRLERIAEGGNLRFNRTPVREIESGETSFVCRGWLPIPEGTLSMIAAPGGTGKTWVSLQLAIRAAEEGKRVFLWLSEDPDYTVRSRYDAVLERVYTPYAMPGRVDISTDDPMLMLEMRGREAKISSRFYAMRRELREYDVIVIDPLLAFFGGDENDNSQARIFMQPFLDWARREKKTIVFLHHSRKSEGFEGGSRARGAGAFVDAVRCVYDMQKITIMRDGKMQPDPNRLHMRRFTLAKDNYGAARYSDGFVFDREITPEGSARTTEIVYEESDPMIKTLPAID